MILTNAAKSNLGMKMTELPLATPNSIRDSPTMCENGANTRMVGDKARIFEFLE